MKINFDELFGDGSEKKHLKKASHASQASTSLGFEQLHMPAAQIKLSPSKILPSELPHNLSKKAMNETMRILQSNKKQERYNWFIQSKLDDEQLNPNQTTRFQKPTAPKQLSKRQAQILSAKLSQPQKCSKKFCNHLCETQTTRRMNQENTNIYPGHHRSLTQVCEYEKRNPSRLHEYLYYEHKTRQFNNIELMKEYQHKAASNQPFKYENPNYTTNYVPFYSRLNEQLDKRAKKQQFYDSNVIYSDQVLQFHPNTTKSKKTFMSRTNNPSINPRKQKFQLKGSGEMRELQNLSSSLNKSFESVMNRSVEIVEQKQEKLIIKLITLFEDNGYFIVKPESIEQLDEKQFEIFCPLISTLQKSEDITIEQFEDKLRTYLKELPKQDKLALRKNDIMKQKQNNIKIKQQKVSQKSALSQATHTNKSKMNAKGDYLDKIKNFV